MFALPPNLHAGTGDHVTGVTCPVCHGVLEVRVEGEGHLHFTCRIGHVFSLREAVQAHEQFLEETLWSAVKSAEELQQLLHDLIADHARFALAPEAAYEARRQRVAEQAAALRRVVEEDQPITFAEPEEPDEQAQQQPGGRA